MRGKPETRVFHGSQCGSSHLADTMAAGEHEVPVNGYVVEVVGCEFCPANFTKFKGSPEKYCSPCRKKLERCCKPTTELKHAAKLRLQ